MNALHRLRPARQRRFGLTLIELVIVLAVIVVLGTLAVPPMARQLARQRLVTAAELYAADIVDARQEAARRGGALHLAATAGPAWCWAVGTVAGCSCSDEAVGPTCRLKAVRSIDHPGVSLISAPAIRLDADGGVETPAAAWFGAGEVRVQVQLSRLGRTRVCDPEGQIAKLPRC